VSELDEAKVKAVEDAVRALYTDAEINQYTPDDTIDHGFVVILPDRRHFSLVVTLEYLEDHSAEQLAEKLAEPTVQEKLQDRCYKHHKLTKLGFVSEGDSWQ
jgi:hypothetical protein